MTLKISGSYLSNTVLSGTRGTVEMKVRAWNSLAFLWFAFAGSTLSATLDIGKGEHPPDVTRTFSGIVQRIDSKTLSVSRPNERHTFLLRDCSEAPASHNSYERTTSSGSGHLRRRSIEPYCAVKVKFLAHCQSQRQKKKIRRLII